MKTICALMLTAALGAVGCTTTGQSIGGDRYAADAPLVEGKAGDKAPAEGTSYAPPVSRVDPDSIDADTAHDLARRLQSDLKADRSATARAGR